MAGHTIYILTGPTASGKSTRAEKVSHTHNGVIINADSLQIYDALPILTARPKETKNTCLYGVLDPCGPSCSAGFWRTMAMKAISATLDQGKTPILVGGTGLYLKALMEGLPPVIAIPPEIHAHGIRLYTIMGGQAFHTMITGFDPVAKTIHPNHRTRLIRLWEVLEATGRPLSYWQTLPRERPPSHWHFTLECLSPPRDVLYDRCNARFLAMMAEGAWEEAQTMETAIAKGIMTEHAPILGALGLKALRACVRGEISQDEAIKRAQTDTRHYAKRQMTWFRHQFPRTYLAIRSGAVEGAVL